MKRSKHNLSYGVAQTMNMGELTPIGVTEVLPGDSIQHATQALVRVSPLNTPVMHPTHAKIMHFFVPSRIIWEDFEDFITRGADGDSAPVYPRIEFASGVAAGSLANYLGQPVYGSAMTIANDRAPSALPFRAYALIYNEYFRDQDLIDPVGLDITSGTDTTTNTTLLSAAWEKDYFTSARPWTQKGPEITIPIGDTAPVVSDGTNPKISALAGSQNDPLEFYNGGGIYRLGVPTDLGNGTDVMFGNNTGLEADLSAVTGIDVNELRLALSLQRFEEARARWGSRYTEYLRYLGVKSSDARLQRPEYLGGGKQTLQYSEVLQTSPVSGTGVGNLAGHGILAMQSNRYRRFFEEHGYVVSLMVIRPKAIYANGSPRLFNKFTYVDYWQKELEHIGQQEVLNKEVYLGATTPSGTFGYQDRYDEYRRNESRVAGEFATSALNTWTQARIFSSEPALNADFVNCIPATRIFQSTATDQLYVMIRHSMQARRLVSKTGSSFIF